MWDAYPAMMTLLGVDNFLGDKMPGFVHINKTGTTTEGQDLYEMLFEFNEFGYCYYQILQDEAERAYHLQVIKDCNTNEATVRPYIFP